MALRAVGRISVLRQAQDEGAMRRQVGRRAPILRRYVRGPAREGAQSMI